MDGGRLPTRDCGATTDFSTQASLLPFGAALPNEGGNIFIADTDHGAAPRVSHGGPELQVLWEATDRVLLSYDATARLFKADEHRSSITFRYESLTVREPDNSR